MINPGRSLAVIVLMFFLLAGCIPSGASAPLPTFDSNSIVTAAAATAYVRLTGLAAQATPTPAATQTPPPQPSPTVPSLPTSIPTIVPLPGVIRANANVRGIPAKSSAHDLGGLLLGQSVGVIGRSVDATWLYIIFPESPTGTGWVTVKAVTLDAELGILPVLTYPNGEEAPPVMLPPYIFRVTGTPLPPATPPGDWPKFGTLLQPANVRIGPSVGFLSMGMLNPGTKVTFRGRTDGNTWVQIDYPSGPDGHGWILAQLVQANDGYGSLPIYDLLGTPVTPTSGEPAATQQAGAPTIEITINTPQATVTPAPPITAGLQGEVSAQINVRNGPAQSYQSLGLLNPKDKITITGRTMNGLWLQIVFSQSTAGVGWVSSQYIKVLGSVNLLPYYNDQATRIP